MYNLLLGTFSQQQGSYFVSKVKQERRGGGDEEAIVIGLNEVFALLLNSEVHGENSFQQATFLHLSLLRVHFYDWDEYDNVPLTFENFLQLALHQHNTYFVYFTFSSSFRSKYLAHFEPA